MELAMWAMIMTMGGVFVALLCEDLAESTDKDTTDSASADWEKSHRG